MTTNKHSSPTVPAPRSAAVGGTHAVVIGAGMAGLFTAKVLSDVYEKVSVLDRDTLPGDGGARGGAPQGRHVHAVLMQATLVIQELFPGLVDELVAEGVPMGDILLRSRTYVGPYRLAQTPSGLFGLCASRPYLEHRIRARLMQLPNIEILAGHTVVALTTDDASTVTGVRVSTATEETTLPADLVVDASGRNSAMPRWLTDLGFEVPPEDRLRIDVAYSSCTFSMPADVIDGDLGVLVTPTPDSPIGGGLIDMGNGQWLVSLSGYNGTHPPVTPEGFVEFTSRLADPGIYQALQHAEPTGKPVRFRITDVTRRRYDKMRRFPHRLIVLGDAVSTFNPVYGQGMSVAAKEALVLRDHLHRHGVAKLGVLRREIARACSPAWDTSTTSDLQMPAVTGHRSVSVRVGNAYLAKLYRAAHYDPRVAVAFMRVVNLLDAPSRLLRPAIVARVLFSDLRYRHRRAEPTPPAPRLSPLTEVAGPSKQFP